jgi:hypothetical protein
MEVDLKEPKPHTFYTNADSNRPDAICDGNGSVCLALCKVCGQAEVELEDSCPGRPVETRPFERVTLLIRRDRKSRKSVGELCELIAQRAYMIQGVADCKVIYRAIPPGKDSTDGTSRNSG